MIRTSTTARTCLLLGLLLSACGSPTAPIDAPTDIVTITSPTPTEVTTASTETSLPPTPLPATDTVCASGCDFTNLQSAINAGGTIIEITDPVHTEAGIVVNADMTVTIRGVGVDATIVQAHETLEDSPERVFLIMADATVTLEEMTIRHGRPSVEDEHGGGIMNYGTLTVRNCVITANSARGGGGIDNRYGTLTIVGSTISNNVARGDGPRGMECGGGGGVKCSSGTMRLINSTIVTNQAGIRSTGLGGGVCTGCGCTAEIVNSTISGNEAAKYGGGVSAMGTASIINSTISGNKTASFGGGIAAAGKVSITNCTITKNTVGGGGGALWVLGEVNLENTIIADNIGIISCTIVSEGDQVGSFGINRNNLIEDGSCHADFSGDPMLGPLVDNGGPTLTHTLHPDSPAIDAIPVTSCTLLTDQRGALRPFALFNPDTPCDIGAFELQND
jgi:hypothetical protein